MIDIVKHGLIILMVLIVAGCAKTPMEIQQEKELILQNKLQQNGLVKKMFIIQDDVTFKRCDNIIVTQVNDNTVIARGNWRSVPEAPTGEVLFSNLTAKPCFALEVNAPEGALVKIGEDETIVAESNPIVRKLDEGEYLIQVTKKGYLPYKQKISFHRMMTLSISLQKEPFLVNGYVIWKDNYRIKKIHQKFTPKAIEGVYVEGDKIWLDDASVKYSYRSWEAAQEVCNKLNKGGIDTWRLPTAGELIATAFYSFKNKCTGSSWDQRCWTDKKNVGVSFNTVYPSRTAAALTSDPNAARCVAKLSDVPNLMKLTEIIANETMEKKLELPKKPMKKEHKQEEILLKGEFETTNDFNRRVQYAAQKVRLFNEDVDKKNELSLSMWKQEVESLKRTHKRSIVKLNDNKNEIFLRSLEEAMRIKYGKPIIRDVWYNADEQTFNFDLISENYNISDRYEKLENILHTIKKSEDGSVQVEAVYHKNNETILKIRILSYKNQYGFTNFVSKLTFRDFMDSGIRSVVFNGKKYFSGEKILAGFSQGDLLYIHVNRINSLSFNTTGGFKGSSSSIRDIEINTLTKQEKRLNSSQNINDYHEFIKVRVKPKYARKFKAILIDPDFKPTVEFEVINSELIFSGIQQIKDPEYLVEEKEYKAAYASISKLKAFIQKYPSSPFRAKAEARISVIAKNNQRAKERRIRLAKEQRIRDAQAAKAQAERNRKAKIARERAAREFATLGVCNVGSSVTHRERWNTTTSSGNIIADGLFGAATKEEFVIYYDGIVQDFVGDKVKVIINDYRIKQTRGGGWFQPQTGRAYEITKHADKYIGKVQFYSRNRCK